MSAAAVAELVRRLGEAIARPDATAADVAGVAGGSISDDGAPLGVHAGAGTAGVESVSVTRRWESEEPNAAEIALDRGLPLAEVEAEFGKGRVLPSATNPGPRRLLLGDARDGWSVLASTDGDEVRTLTVRRDD